LGDIEDVHQQASIPKAETALLFESFSHMKDRRGLLDWMSTRFERLVMRVNVRPENEVKSTVFGDSMNMPSERELRAEVTDNGWDIMHWCVRSCLSGCPGCSTTLLPSLGLFLFPCRPRKLLHVRVPR